jgi:hypothetical protein
MGAALSPIERLDLAARVEAKANLISYGRFVLSCLSLLCIVVMVASEASGRDVWAIRLLAAVGAILSVALWFDWRYNLYAISILCFALATLFVLGDKHPLPHTVPGWIGAYFSDGLVPVYWGCVAAVFASRYAKVKSDDWQRERHQVDGWLWTLKHQSGKDIIEFASGSFWTGYWTYRILNPGDCWVIAQFKRGTTKVAHCRVRELNQVALTRLTSGKWKITVTDKRKTKSFTEIELSPELPSTLERFVQQPGG